MLSEIFATDDQNDLQASRAIREKAVRCCAHESETNPTDEGAAYDLETAWAMLLDFCAETGMQHGFEDTTNEAENRPPLRGEVVQMSMF